MAEAAANNTSRDELRRERTAVLRKRFLPSTTNTLTFDQPSASIVILNFNGEGVIEQCLEAVGKVEYPHAEIIVVDNGSSDRSIQRIRSVKEHIPLRLVTSDTNLGVAGGRNLGMKYAQGEVVAFLDNDAFPEADWLETATAELFSSPEAGAVAPFVFFAHAPLLANGLGGAMDRRGYARDLGYGLALERIHRKEEVLYPMGCGMVVRRSALEEIGSFDPVLPKWFDDVELGIKVWQSGYTVRTAPLSVVNHAAHTSDQMLTPGGWRQALLFEKARLRNVLKFFPAEKLPGFFLRELQSSFEKPICSNMRSFLVTLLAAMWNLLHLPSTLGHRRRWAAPPHRWWKVLESEALNAPRESFRHRSAR